MFNFRYGGTDPMGKLLIGLAGKVVSSEDIKEVSNCTLLIYSTIKQNYFLWKKHGHNR